MKNCNISMAVMLFTAMITISCKKAGAVKANGDKPGPVAPGPVNPNPVTSPSLVVPMAGNAYVTVLAAGGSETVTSTKLAGWTNANSIFSTYFRLATAGKLTVKLTASVPSGNSTVKVTVNGTTFTVSLSGAAYSTYDVGTVDILNAGYIKVDFQGLSKTGTYFADVTELLISGTASANALFANDPANFYWSRRGPSVHLNYTAPANTEWFYTEVTVPAGQDNIGSFLWQMAFQADILGCRLTRQPRGEYSFQYGTLLMAPPPISEKELM